jgi:hypothetical protein
MINPVNSEKTVQTTTDKPNQSRANTQTGVTTTHDDPAQPPQAPAADHSVLDVDNARQLYAMENAQSAAATTLTTSQQARSLVDTIVQQFSTSPESAAKAQMSQVSQPMTNLLASAPV